jgi:peptide deformylase
VGIAAPQVGVNRRVVLVKRLDREPDKPIEAYLNPEIAEFSEEKVVDWEGCLSIPAGFGKVRRAESITVTYETPGGERKTEKISGFTARIFQHEIDHLDGVLFIDRKEPGELMPEKEYREMRKKEKEQQGQK